MKKECIQFFELWEKYCKNKTYTTLSIEGVYCSSIMTKYNECIFKKKNQKYNK